MFIAFVNLKVFAWLDWLAQLLVSLNIFRRENALSFYLRKQKVLLSISIGLVNFVHVHLICVYSDFVIFTLHVKHEQELRSSHSQFCMQTMRK